MCFQSVVGFVSVFFQDSFQFCEGYVDFVGCDKEVLLYFRVSGVNERESRVRERERKEKEKRDTERERERERERRECERKREGEREREKERTVSSSISMIKLTSLFMTSRMEETAMSLYSY
jgi:hypothetical protein